MNDSTKSVPLSTVALYLIWVWILGNLIVGWVLMFVGHPHLAVMFGLTAAVSTAAATAATSRCYVSRICGLMRTLAVDEDQRRPDLQRVP